MGRARTAGACRGIFAATIAALALFAAPSYATVTGSNITSPASGQIVVSAPNHTGTLTITGTTTTTGTPGNVDIVCYDGSNPAYDWQTVVANVTVTNGAFARAVSPSLAIAGACTLRAIPTGTESSQTTSSLSAFTGPQLTTDFREPFTVNNASLYDFYYGEQQSQAYADYRSVSSCGFCDSRLLTDATNFYNSTYLFSGNAALYAQEFYPDTSRAEAQIDGHNVLFPTSAEGVDPTGTGLPALSVSSSAGANGDLTITEDEDAVRCPTDVLPYGTGAGQNNCTTFLPTGVHLHRMIIQTGRGTVVRIVDVWSSTDGAPHNLSLDYDQSFLNSSGDVGSLPAYQASYAFPWVSASYAAHGLGDTVPGPAASSAPVSMFVKANSAAADGDTYYPQGAITFDPAPSSLTFTNVSSEVDQRFVASFRAQLAAGGTVTIKQSFAIGSTRAGIATLAAQAEDQQDVPVVAIGSPANGTTVSVATVTITGTASDRTISAVTVNGKPATVSGGTFSAAVALAPGANTITAVAADGAGNRGSASVAVAYVPPTATLSGAVKGSGDVSFSLVCHAVTGAVCRGRAQLITLEQLLGAKVVAVSARATRHHQRLVVGSAGFTVRGGATEKLHVSLNGTGRKLLKHFGRLPVTLQVTLTGANTPAPLSHRVTIKPVRRGKHHG